jgi:uncharacterized phage infection (PIP) family protein YhgE
VLALLGSSPGFAVASDVGTPADATIVAVTDVEQLNELADANDVDHGMVHDVDNGSEHDANDQNDLNDQAENAKEQAENANEQAENAQEDAIEATQEHGNEHGGDNAAGV